MAVLALALRSVGADAATFVPGAPEADPPTGATVQPEPPHDLPQAGGIRWELAPVRYSGSVSLDGRLLRLGNGTRSAQGLVINDIEFATYVWQPWFIQLRAGLGTLVAQDSTRGADTPPNGNTSTSLTGRLTVSVFPVSRFPFELRADVSDSRVRGDSFGADYRSRRFGVSQAYSPESSNDSYSLNFDHSRLSSGTNGGDTVNSLRGTAVRQFSGQSVELSGQLTTNTRTDTDSRSRIATLTGRHTFEPATALHVDTLATLNQVQLHGIGGSGGFDSTTGIRQISSFATWRPREGQWLYSETSPVYLNASARLVDTSTDAGGATQSQRAINASLGASQDLTPEWRLGAGMSFSVLFPDGRASTHATAANASTTYTPAGLSLGPWRYTPSMSANLGVGSSSEGGSRHAIGSQANHAVSRSWPLGERDLLSVNLSQSLSASQDSQAQGLSRALSHSGGVSWQGIGGEANQSYAALSVSDSRSWAQEASSFQIINLQVSRRTQLSRDASWSGNLTVQASQSDTVSTAATPVAAAGWQRYFSGSLNYENRRVMGVPRLRFTGLLTLNSQQLESRAVGDIDAPRERISRALEARLDYSIGRLDARLTARTARVEGRSVASVFLHIQRNY